MISKTSKYQCLHSRNSKLSTPNPELKTQNFDGSAGIGFFAGTNAVIMIQRVQTIFLALIVVLFAALFFLPVFKLTITMEGVPLSSFRSLGSLPLLLIDRNFSLFQS
jgi:hypothetical protein